MQWHRELHSFPPGGPGEPDCHRASRPWVLEDSDGTLRMWYSGNDRTTSRILHAVKRPEQGWERLGPVVEPGLAGVTDDFGVESPSVVRTPGGYLMVYGGYDGEVTRLHMAMSEDGLAWEPQGTVLQRGDEDWLGATHPCLLTTGERWWLFYTGYRHDGEVARGSILAAVSTNGASWDRVGCVLEPDSGDLAASYPCVIDLEREFEMFYVSDHGNETAISLATSPDGVSWDRRGPLLAPSEDGPDSGTVETPCVVRLMDGSVHMWYSAGSRDDTEGARQILSARFGEPNSSGYPSGGSMP